ncbi:MAG: 50S ribosomal protein L25 [Acidimicrobiales bacterium]|nr:50S ribosomal protein L25 [Acidimicrobiales bacterium]
MPELTLVADTGRPLGSRASNRLRNEGKVPGVVYGHGSDPVSVAVDARTLRHILVKEGANAVIDLVIDGEKKLTLVRDLQRDPIRRAISHIDFLLIRRDEVLAVDVPIVLEGEAADVEREGGLVTQSMSSLTVQALPGDIPAQIVIDISPLTLGQQIRVGDLQLPAGVTTEVDPEELVVAAEQTRAAAVEGEAEGEAEAEGAEAGGEAAEPAES